MKNKDRLDKIEKQLNLLMLKVDIIYNKIADNDECFGGLNNMELYV